MPRTYTPAFRLANPKEPIVKDDPRRMIINTQEHIHFYPSDYATELKHFSGVIRMRHRRASQIANQTAPGFSAYTVENSFGSSIPPGGWSGPAFTISSFREMHVSQPPVDNVVQFSYSVSGKNDGGVTWEIVSGSATVDANGFLTASLIEEEVIVKATSLGSPVLVAQTDLIYMYDPKIVITPATMSVGTNGALSIPVTTTSGTWPVFPGAGGRQSTNDFTGYSWTLSGSGAISPTGLDGQYTAPNQTGTYKAYAESRTFPGFGITADVEINVTASVIPTGTIPTITHINAVSNVFGATPFRLLVGQGMAITGTMLDLVTAVQFEEYGPDNDGPPYYNLLSPSPTATFSWLPDSGSYYTAYTQTPTTITVSAAEVQNLNLNWGLTYNTWYKVVLTY